MCRLSIFLVLALLLVATAAAGLPPNLQLGRVAMDGAGHGWEIAVPLDVSPAQVRLETDDRRLRLITLASRGSAGETDSAWLVLSPLAEGPVSGLLHVERDIEVETSVVAGEIVRRREGDPWPELLVHARTGSARRALRPRGLPPFERATLGAGRATISASDPSGWQILDVHARHGRTESEGSLQLADGSAALPLRVSAAETITVLGELLLDPNLQWESVLPLWERLDSNGLRARVALRGRSTEGRVLRVRRVRYDRQQTRFEPVAEIGLRKPPSGFGVRTLGMKLPATGLRTLPRRDALLHLSGSSARLFGVRGDRIARGDAGEFRFARAATVSSLDQRAAFAVRRSGDGALYLTRWQVRGRAGERRLRPRIFEPSLQARLGAQALRPFSLMSLRLPAEVRQGQRIRERLVLLAGATPRAKARYQPRLLTLRRDPQEPRLLGVRTRWISDRWNPAEGPAPCLLPVPSARAGSEGFPLATRVSLPAVQQSRLLRLFEPGGQFQERYALALSGIGSASGGFALRFPRYLRAESGPQSLRLQRIADTPNGPLVRASNELPAVQAVDLKASSRRRQAWALIENPEARYLRLLSTGLPAGTNLPPFVDAGPDLRIQASEPEGAAVELQARPRDVNGDPLRLRWAAAGVRFDDPNAATTQGFFPVGTTQVRVRVRESGKAIRYQAQDVIEVVVEAPTAAEPAPGLDTRLVGLFPNPANPRVRVSFTLGRSGEMRLRVLDARGRLVRTLAAERRAVGAHEIVWNGFDDAGQPAASGVYFVELRTDDRRDTQRVALVR